MTTMRQLTDSHEYKVFLSAGEVFASRQPALVSTILGSCVAITMYSPRRRVGAICHAMLPGTPLKEGNLFYVKPAIGRLHSEMLRHGCETAEVVVKVFGGAQMFCDPDSPSPRLKVGKQNLDQTFMALGELGLRIAANDIGGRSARKLYFSIKTGDVYLRKSAPSSAVGASPPEKMPDCRCGDDYLPNASPQPTGEPDLVHPDAYYGSQHIHAAGLYHGPLPDRPLLFGHFLYYSGVISWQTIVQILVWQKNERLRLGDIGQSLGLLRRDDISKILQEKAPSQLFGQTAKDLSLLTESQVHSLVMHQRLLQKKFGTILLEKNLISKDQLEKLLHQFVVHNLSQLQLGKVKYNGP